MMFPVLEEQIRKSCYNLDDIAAELGISRSSLQRKRNGETAFKWDECMMLKDILEYDGSVEDLFYY